MNRSGFTFIELIITVTIFTVIIVTVYSVFYMGMKAWHRGENGTASHKIRLGFLKIEKELKNTFFFSNFPFKWSSQEMIFPLSVSEEDTEKIYSVNYIVEKDADTKLKQLLRKERKFSLTAGEETEIVEETVRKLMPLMELIEFSYAAKTEAPIVTEVEWQSDWSDSGLPFAVRILLQLNESEERYTKVILIH